MERVNIANLKGADYCVKVAMSVNEKGIKEPLMIDRAGNVIDGRKRLAAARSLGYTSVPVVYVGIQPMLIPESTTLGDLAPNTWCKSPRHDNSNYYFKLSADKYLEVNSTTFKYKQVCITDRTYPAKVIKLKQLHVSDKFIPQEMQPKTSITAQRMETVTRELGSVGVGTLIRRYSGSNIYVVTSKHGGRERGLMQMGVRKSSNYTQEPTYKVCPQIIKSIEFFDE